MYGRRITLTATSSPSTRFVRTSTHIPLPIRLPRTRHRTPTPNHSSPFHPRLHPLPLLTPPSSSHPFSSPSSPPPPLPPPPPSPPSPTMPSHAAKDFSSAMADAYHPPQVESGWDSWWESQGLYRPQSDFDPSPPSPSDPPPFILVIPPPNVTGTLHLGHALTCSIEDAITRYHRMNGRNTLWLPGTDHAGIATQVVVEKKLMKEQQRSRHDLGREPFIEEVWKWKQANGDRIKQQIRRLGASVDWSREAFTMDAQLSRAVQRAFITLHERGLIYRSNRLVNWSCALRTAISSIEVEHTELDKPTLIRVPGYATPIEFGVIHSFAYRLADDSGEEVVVSTTRIETMLGDTAVAVHPTDARYTRYHGKQLRHPFLPSRLIPIICDDRLVDPTFGTGAVKVTPAHDPNDFDCGARHHLPSINIFTDAGDINEAGGAMFAGMKRFDARQAVIERLQAAGLYRGKATNKMSLGICSRSKDIVEPVIRPQWWVNCQSMAKRAVDKVRDEELKIVPAAFEKTWFQWLDNIQDWCISRQLWWGHRIPAYHISVPSDPSFASHSSDENAFWVTGSSASDALLAAHRRFPHIPPASFILTQDEDVLDTWFSSGLFPFSTMGWPTPTPDLARFYPGTLLETGHDILFFWVARMVMLGLELTDTLPFTTVYLHAMVRDKFGRKMSKSLGNVVDPLDVIDGITLSALHDKLLTGNLPASEVEVAKEGQKRDFPDGISQCGADALRFGLLAYSAQGRDVNLDIQRVVAYRQFGNKLWQATRFALLNFDAAFTKPASLDAVRELVSASGNLADRWILSRLCAAAVRANAGFDGYQFAEVTTAVYNFWLYDLCDVYLELIKPIVKTTDTSQAALTARASSLAVLYVCLRTGLLLLHPLMPFISEELYHRLPQAMVTEEEKAGTGGRLQCGSIMVQPYPSIAHFGAFASTDVEALQATLLDIGKAARSTRSTLGLTKKRVDVYLLCSDDATAASLAPHTRDVATLTIANAVHVLPPSRRADLPPGCTTSVVSPTVELHIPLRGLVDFGAEVVKMEKQRNGLREAVASLQAKVGAAGYVDKTKADVKERNEAKLRDDTAEIAKLTHSIDAFNALMTPEELAQYRQQKVQSKQLDADRARVAMEKILPAGGDEAKLSKKIASKYADLKAEHQQLLAEVQQLQLSDH